MDALLYDWPFVGLAVGLVCFALLLLWPRPPSAPPRTFDPAWLIALFTPLYMLHQFEEHGYDLLGERYQFLSGLCHLFAPAGSGRECPAGPGFIAAVNPGAIWIAGALGFALRRTRPIVGAFAWGVVITNIPAHVVMAIATLSYNPGLVTAALLFVPLSVVALRGFVRAGVIDRKRIGAIIASGAALHGVLMFSLIARQHEWINDAAVVAINVLNGLVPAASALAVGAPRSHLSS